MVSDNALQTKLGDYVEDAHVMETNVLQMLGSMISTTSDPEIRGELERHKEQTEAQEQRLRDRLEALSRSPSIRKETQTIVGALMKGVADQVRGDKPGRNARDGLSPSTWRSPPTNSWSGSPSAQATGRQPRSLVETSERRNRWPRR